MTKPSELPGEPMSNLGVALKQAFGTLPTPDPEFDVLIAKLPGSFSRKPRKGEH